MSSSPDMSIVVPTLNEEEYLEEALTALRNQFTPKEYEIIVSDGHSTDRTVEIAKKYADKVVFEKKRTISAGRQAGAKAAEGKVIVSAGADVYVDSHWLDTLTRPLLDKTHAASMGPVLPRDGNHIENIFSHGLLKPLGSALSRLDAHFVAADNMAIDAEVFHKAGGFNPDLVTGEDTDLIRRVKSHGKVVYLPDAHSYVSMRRVREWGYWKYLSFHTTNFFKYHVKGEAHKEYEPVR